MTAEEILLELVEAARAFGDEESSGLDMSDAEREFWNRVYRASRFLRGETVEPLEVELESRRAVRARFARNNERTQP